MKVYITIPVEYPIGKKELIVRLSVAKTALFSWEILKINTVHLNLFAINKNNFALNLIKSLTYLCSIIELYIYIFNKIKKLKYLAIHSRGTYTLMEHT